MPVTARDIALQTGISPSTVSRVLNNHPHSRIAVETRKRVLEAAQRLGYQPNALARSLRSGRTNVIGLYTSHQYDARNDFLGAVLGGLQHACARRRLDLLLSVAGQTGETDTIFNGVRDGRIDGLLLHILPDDPLIERLRSSTVRVVAMADPLPGLPSVVCDDAGGMARLVSHFVARGIEEFAFVAPEARLASIERRLGVWRLLLQARGIPENRRTVLRIDWEEAAPAVALSEGRSKPVGVCCWNDRTAYSLLRACARQGIAVPEQLAISGFDGFVDDKLPARALTTIACPWAELAEKAVDLLWTRLRGEEIPAETVLPVALLEGDTT